MNASRRMALCGMLTALAVVILLLGGSSLWRLSARRCWLWRRCCRF